MTVHLDPIPERIPITHDTSIMPGRKRIALSFHSPRQKRSRARSRLQMPVPQDAVPELQMPVPQEIDLAVPEVTLPKGLRYEPENFKQEFSRLP